MALGGGTFTSQNKELPGSYMNFISTAQASAALSERGIVTMPLMLDWGKDGEVFEVSAEQFQNKCLAFFGYEYSDDAMKRLRDLFCNARTLYAYRLNSNGAKATCTYATAKCSGTRGNSLKIVISANVDNASLKDVKTIFGTTVVDVQTVSTSAELVDNDFVDFNKSASLTITAGQPLQMVQTGQLPVLHIRLILMPLNHIHLIQWVLKQRMQLSKLFMQPLLQGCVTKWVASSS